MSLPMYDLALGRAESDLIGIGQRLDRDVPAELRPASLLVLGHRARTMFTGIIRLLTSDAPAASAPLARTAVEINLTVRFIVAKPELHTELWVAEGERQNAVLVRELEADRELAAKIQWPPFGDDWYANIDEYVNAARAKAVAAGVVGVSDTGPVMPGMRLLAVNHGDLATREAYTMVYRSLSQFTHGSSRAFGEAGFVRDGDVVRFDDLAAFDENQKRAHRALNITTFASTLVVLGEPLRIDFDDARLIQDLIVAARIGA